MNCSGKGDHEMLTKSGKFEVFNKEDAAYPDLFAGYCDWFFKPVDAEDDLFSDGYLTQAEALAAAEFWEEIESRAEVFEFFPYEPHHAWTEEAA